MERASMQVDDTGCSTVVSAKNLSPSSASLSPWTRGTERVDKLAKGEDERSYAGVRAAHSLARAV
jgi:hypothetical protein